MKIIFYLSFQIFSFNNIGDGLNCILSRELIFFDVEKIIILVKMKLPNLRKATSNHFIRKFSLVKFLNSDFLSLSPCNLDRA